MFRSRKTRIAALITAGALTFSASPALAQSQAVGQINQGNLISALNNVSAQVSDIQALNDLTITDVRVVNVEDVANNNRVLNNALNRNDVNIVRNSLNNFLNNSLNNINVEILNNALNQNNVTVDDVVAVNVLSDGTVVLFVQDQT